MVTWNESCMGEIGSRISMGKKQIRCLKRSLPCTADNKKDSNLDEKEICYIFLFAVWFCTPKKRWLQNNSRGKEFKNDSPKNSEQD